MIKKAFAILLFSGLVLAGCATARVKAPPTPVVTGVSISDNAVEIKVSGAFTYTVYKPTDPFNVTIEMPGVGTAPGISEKMFSDKEGVSEVTVVKTDKPLATKIQLLLDSPSDLEPVLTSDSLILKIKKAAEAPETPSEAATEAAPEAISPEAAIAETADETPEIEAEPAPMTPATEISDMWFDYSEGTLKVVIKGNGSMEPNVYSLPGRIVVDVPSVAMKAPLPETVITPVKAVRFGMHKDKVRIVLDMKKDVEFTTTPVADSIVIAMPAEEVLVKEEPAAAVVAGKEAAPAKPDKAEKAMKTEPVKAAAAPEAAKAEAVKPAAEESAPAPENGSRIISLDFQNADIVPIYRFLGDVAGYNVVIHPGVSGRITLKLMNVQWQKALDIVLEMSGFDKKVDDKNRIITVAASDVFQRQETEKAKLKEVSRKVAEPVRRDLVLAYIDAASMKIKLDEAKAEGCTKSVRIDDRLNALILYDTEDCINSIMKEVGYWDTPEHRVMQVMIEAKIIEVSTSYSTSFGIKWGSAQTYSQGSLSADFSVNSPVGAAGSSANADGGAIKLGFADSVSVDLSISALESVGKTKKLSNPRVLTVDGQGAMIQQGVQIPVTTTTAAGTQTTFKNANLMLNVTPTIKRHDFIEIVVAANNDTPVQVGGQTGINTQSVTTKALVKDGETLVLGGIYVTQESSSESRVPVLGRLPLLGAFFKTSSLSGPSPQELLVFITPRIVR